ncbi:MFS transporter [Bacillus sp. FJAT-28004]|uniref:MFS transporter n=1 Tax=Bacillus sp. FJAT-28004 TaxID=1679165 RepID=UPI0006B5C0E4|nr:MFS transporter [Bacillus sp. FJAT-28004]
MLDIRSCTNLVSLAPQSSWIVLSLNSTFVQLGFASGADFGGITVGNFSITAVTWISATSAMLAAIIAILSSPFPLSKYPMYLLLK